MRRLRAGFWLLGAVVALAGPAAAGRVQVFVEVSQRVVGVGEPFRVEVATIVASAADAGALERAFAEISFDLGPDVELVREEPGEAERSRFEGEAVLLLRRRLVVRALREGPFELPALAFALGGEAVTTRPYRLHAYQPSERLYAAARSVLPVVAEGRHGSFIGSAFVVAPDAVVTSYHVVTGADRVRIELPDGTRLGTRKVWAVDPYRDIVVLHVDSRAVQRAGLVPLAVAPDDESSDVAFTAGWPGGTQRTGAGVRYDDLCPAPDQPVLVSSNRVAPGDSGGPLLDRHGRVLGVVTSGRAAPEGSDVLPEDVCLATDPRWAIARWRAARRPYGLRETLALHARAQPPARVLEITAAFAQRVGARERRPHLEALRHLAAEAPRNPSLQFLIGTAFEAAGDRAHAAAAYQTALDGFGGYFPAAYALGHHHLRAGRLDEAVAAFEAVRRHEPYARLAAFELARLAVARLDYAEAERHLRDVLHLAPRFAPALYLLGYCRLARGAQAEAAGLAVLLRRLSPGWAERLALHLRAPVLQPVALAALPPGPALMAPWGR